MVGSGFTPCSWTKSSGSSLKDFFGSFIGERLRQNLFAMGKHELSKDACHHRCSADLVLTSSRSALVDDAAKNVDENEKVLVDIQS